MADPSFFDDAELLRIGISLPTVNALREAYTRTSSNTVTLLNADEIERLAIDASAQSDDALNLVSMVISDLSQRPEPIDASSDLQLLSQKIDQIMLQLSSIEDFSGRVGNIEQRLEQVELLANGNNVLFV